MKTLFLTSLTTVAYLISGCGGSSDDTSATVSQAPSSQSIQSVQRNAHYLTDARGFALYTFDNDTLNVSNCTDALLPNGKTCLQIWPIFHGKNSNNAQFNVLPDNAMHTALMKHPLYFFVNDTQAGDTKGDWVNNIWHLAYTFNGFNETDDVKRSAVSHPQTYLTDEKGLALYTFDNDTPNNSNCSNEAPEGELSCLAKWPVFYVDMTKVALPNGVERSDLDEIVRADGIKQTTYKGEPLYYFFQDAVSGETKGDWVGGVWHLIELPPK